MASIQLNAVQKWFGDLQVIKGIDLAIEDGEFVVFVGPSGCGKSTLLRIIAGLEDASEGAVIINDNDVTGNLPSERGLAMVFQSYALYPHMNVAENIGFALKTAGMPAAETKDRVDTVAGILKLESLLDRLPKQLSGGQRQRVAIGRAIVREPVGFLFDEPLSNLDAALRVNMRLEISRLHGQLGITTIYVTHDQIEAMTLADRIVVLDEGRIMQAGSPRELYNNPKSRFVAEFIGSPKMNVLPCVDKVGKIVFAGQSRPAARKTAPDGASSLSSPATTIASLGIRPENIALCAADAGHINGSVAVCEYLGSEQFAYIDCGFEDLVTVRVEPDEAVPVGSVVGLFLDRDKLYGFDDHGVRL
jgi:multiple sugar transport system ATP-binding protein